MSLVRLLPLLLLLPTLIFATDEDRLYRVAPEQFKEGVVMEKITDAAIQNEGLNSVSVMPQFPLRSSTIYLRHKRGPKEYHWYVGRMDPENFKKLHAFSLKDNYLKAEDVAYMRFYGSQMNKAFQDENDIYFDKHYIYTSRISRLFFMANGRWQILKETELPGAISIDTTIAGLKVSSYTLRMKKFFSEIYPVKSGLYAFGFAKDGFMPYVDAQYVAPGEQVRFIPKMPVLPTDSITDVKTSVTLESVASTQTLEQTEALYDLFINEVKDVYALVDTSRFAEDYPAVKLAAALNATDSSEAYVEYVKNYNETRAQAMNLWRNCKLGIIGKVNMALLHKIDSLQSLPLSGTMVPEKIEPVFESGSNNQRMESLRLTFGKERNRFDFVWVGNAAGVIPDTLFAILDAASSVRAHISLENNKPVWIYEDGKLTGRHHYRYNEFTLIVEDQTYECNGAFLLPIYIRNQPEVQAWLAEHPAAVVPPAVKPAVEPVVEPAPVDTAATATADTAKVDTAAAVDSVKVDSAAAADSVKVDSAAVAPVDTAKAPADTTAKADTVVAPVPEAPAPVAEEAYDENGVPVKPLPRIVTDMIHGTVALIDSGEFRYKGKVVRMSPFAIQTTEVTQEFYKAVKSSRDSAAHDSIVIGKDRSRYADSLKPVHDITWYDARNFCLAIGGDLPTEAQWEFAGRADNNEGALWNMDEEPDAGNYAVYRENSYKLEKTAPGYGPQRVAGKKPNEWGLYDMSGNVAEWTKDSYFMFSFWVESSNPTGAMMGSHKVYKGGSWKDKEKYLNLTTRDDEDPRYWSDGIGFRCAFPRSVFEGK